ncbi:MAG: protein kinase domain-containing protein [Rhodospirillaceae bacterium]
MGPYHILSKVGEGGMGEVYRAHDPRLERDVAVKVLPADAVADATARARLLREARLASKLNHPHICTVYDVGEDQGRAYIAMELIEGQSLSDRLHRGALPIPEVLRYGAQMAGALAHAHARGVVHRDFKSANVVVTPDGQVKVLDFGLAKRLVAEDEADAATRSRQSLTEVGMTPGTLAYMAPEQLRGQPADARSDIWALGIVLYELVSGQRPFQGKTGFELSSAILNQPVPAVPPAVPAPLAAVIDHCLAKEPGDRYQRADEVRAALDAAASGQTTPLPASRRATRGRRRASVAALATVLALVVIALAVVALDVGGARSRLRGAVPGTGAPAAARIVRLAVLPFANVSGDAKQDYLSDGLTTEMIALLGRIHPETLHVIARTTAMRYKKTDKTIDEIGRELGVDYVLEGSAQREAGRIRITADLIKVADQTQLWAERYERELAGILVLQNDVAQQVARALALKLLPAEQARLADARTVDPEVYDLCLKGGHRLAGVTKGDIDAAEQYFQRAVAKDPAYAGGYVGLSAVWALRQQMGLAHPREAGPKARTAALKAIDLDESLAGAHGVLGDVYAWTDFNFPAADREYKRLIELAPNDAGSRATYSHILMILGQPDEAMRQIERAMSIDPLDDLLRMYYTAVLLGARRYEDALTQARVLVRAQPGNLGALSALVAAGHMKKQYAEVITAAAAAAEGTGRPDVAEALKKGYAQSGYANAWRKATEVELAKHGGEPGVASDAVNGYLMAGDNARALDWLEKAYAERDPYITYIGCLPIFDPLRAEPRFHALMRKMNLPK